MFRIIIVLICIFLGGLAQGARHTISSLPYNAGTSYDTLSLSGSKVTGSGDGIVITGHDIVLDLTGDTLAFGAGGGSGNIGIEINNGAYNIKIIGGTILHQGLAGSSNVCLFLGMLHDLSIENTDMVIGGIDGHCIATPSIGPPGQYNINITGGHYTSYVSSFSSRCYYDGSVIKLTNATYSGYGDYHYNLQGLRILNGHAQSIVVYGRPQGNGALTYISACTLYADSRNDMYPCQPGQCETCQSNTNPYQLLLCILGPGSKISNNYIYSGDQYSGCRGIMLENCLGTPSQPIEVFGNHIDVHEGPNGEDSHGSLQAFRIRSIDSGVHGYLHIYDNLIKGTVDSNPNTPAIGNEVRLFYHSVQPQDYGFVTVERNTFIAETLDGGTDCKAFVVERMESASNVPGNEYRYNRIESGGTIVKLGDYNLPGNDIILRSDTLAFRPYTASNKATWKIGRYDGGSMNNQAVDCVFENGASDTNIVWTTCLSGNNQFWLERTLSATVMGNNELPVPFAEITVVNNYGKTVASGLTNRWGRFSKAIKYWYEAEDTPDSVSFNNFLVTARKDNDNSGGYVNLSSYPGYANLTLWNTAGEECTDCEYICGDFDNDTIINLVDLLLLIDHIFHGGTEPFDFNAMDMIMDGRLDLLDVLRFIDSHYDNGPPLECP